jgi:hypothetical protein
MKYISRALISLGVNEFYLTYDGVPSSEEEFNEAFFKMADEGHLQGISHISPITWDQINTKANELRNAEPLNLLRNERNRLLAETDWTQNADVPEATRSNWLTYRQSLRDITQTYTSLNDVVWPAKPA